MKSNLFIYIFLTVLIVILLCNTINISVDSIITFIKRNPSESFSLITTVLNLITAIGTVIIAIWTVKSFKEIVGNQVIEKQLQTVLNLIETIESKKINICKKSTHNKGVSYSNNIYTYTLLELSKISEGEMSPYGISDYLVFEQGDFLRLSDKVVTFIEELLLYRNNVFIPTNIKDALNNFFIDYVRITPFPYNVEYVIEDDVEKLKISDNKIYPYSIISLTLKEEGILKEESEKFILFNPSDKKSTYYNWFNFRDRFIDLRKTIKDWMKQKGVEDINI